MENIGFYDLRLRVWGIWVWGFRGEADKGSEGQRLGLGVWGL